MKTGTVVWIIVIALLIVGAFMIFASDNGIVEEGIVEEINNEEEADIVAVILYEENSSGQSGTAVIEDVNGLARVTVDIIASSETGTEQPAHIHLNNCADIGAVAYPLNNVIDGGSVTILDLTVDELMSDLPLSLNVHKSIAEADIYVACGDLLAS